MVDLSAVQGRSTATEDIATRRRGQLIPSDPNEALPHVQQTISLRDANIGSGNADAVRKALGMGQDLQTSFLNYQGAKDEQQNLADASQGVADQTNGTVDPVKQAKSTAYSVAIGTGYARAALVQMQTDLPDKLNAALAQSRSANPTQGQAPMTVQDADHMVTDVVKPYLMDANGKPVDYGHPEANAYLYEGVAKLRAQLLAQAQKTIHAQETDKAASSVEDGMKLNVMSGQPPDIEGAMKQYSALGMDPKVAKGRLMDTLVDTAMTVKDASVLSVAATSRRPDGTPSWSPQEQTQLLESYHRLSDQFRVEHDKTSRDASAMVVADTYIKMANGWTPSPDDIKGLMAQPNGLRPEDVPQLMALKDRVDERKWQDIQHARSNQEFSWSQQEHAHTMTKWQASENAGHFMAQVYSSNVGPGDAMRELNKAYLAGQFDDETHGLLVREIKGIPTDGGIVKRAGGEDHEVILNDAIQSIRRAVPQNPAAQAQFGKDISDAQTTFYRGLRAGDVPKAALANALTIFRQPQATIDSWVGRAEKRHSTNTMKADMAK